MKQCFLYGLNPPRPTFVEDMTAEETGIMSRHGRYWTGLMEDGVAVAFGPVDDPSGAWGVAIVAVDSLNEALALRGDDPAVSPGMATVDVFPMPLARIGQQRRFETVRGRVGL